MDQRLLDVQDGGFVELIVDDHVYRLQFVAIRILQMLRKTIVYATSFSDVHLRIIIDEIHHRPISAHDAFAESVPALRCEIERYYIHKLSVLICGYQTIMFP